MKATRYAFFVIIIFSTIAVVLISAKSCEEGEWVEHEQTQVVQTAWAMIALIHGKYPKREAIEKGVKLITDRQLPVSFIQRALLSFLCLNKSLVQDGSWAQEAVEGIFNKTCSIAYPNFKFSFTIWALGKASRYLKELKQ